MQSTKFIIDTDLPSFSQYAQPLRDTLIRAYGGYNSFFEECFDIVLISDNHSDFTIRTEQSLTHMTLDVDKYRDCMSSCVYDLYTHIQTMHKHIESDTELLYAKIGDVQINKDQYRIFLMICGASAVFYE